MFTDVCPARTKAAMLLMMKISMSCPNNAKPHLGGSVILQGTSARYCIDGAEQSLSCWGAVGLQAVWAGWLCGRPCAPAQSACNSPG